MKKLILLSVLFLLSISCEKECLDSDFTGRWVGVEYKKPISDWKEIDSFIYVDISETKISGTNYLDVKYQRTPIELKLQGILNVNYTIEENEMIWFFHSGDAIKYVKSE